MAIRLARAYGVRPNELYSWDYWQEYTPAIEQLLEISMVDEIAPAVFGGKSKQTASPGVLRTKQDRVAAFDRMQKEAELKKVQNG